MEDTAQAHSPRFEKNWSKNRRPPTTARQKILRNSGNHDQAPGAGRAPISKWIRHRGSLLRYHEQWPLDRYQFEHYRGSRIGRFKLVAALPTASCGQRRDDKG